MPQPASRQFGKKISIDFIFSSCLQCTFLPSPLPLASSVFFSLYRSLPSSLSLSLLTSTYPSSLFYPSLPHRASIPPSFLLLPTTLFPRSLSSFISFSFPSFLPFFPPSLLFSLHPFPFSSLIPCYLASFCFSSIINWFVTVNVSYYSFLGRDTAHVQGTSKLSTLGMN